MLLNTYMSIIKKLGILGENQFSLNCLVSPTLDDFGWTSN